MAQPTTMTLTGGLEVPRLLYGTAWKEETTTACTASALAAGFRGIDTANQRRHYDEERVGRAVASWMAGGQPRAELFLQTKFTHPAGQDHRLPYDPDADRATQVRQSVASSLEHLRVTYLDALLIHGPEGPRDPASGSLAPDDHVVWRTLEELHDEGIVGALGISNIVAPQLRELLATARIPPLFVQNRCRPDLLRWDAAVRELCAAEGVVYQAFNVLRHPSVWESSAIRNCAHRHGKSAAQIVYRWVVQQDMILITGTTDPQHQREALAIFDFELSPDEISAIEALGT